MKSVVRIVATMTILQQHPGARLDEIATKLGIHKSNALRLLRSLERVGWVSRDTTGLSHLLGSGLISMGQSAIDQFALSDQLIPMMQSLRDASGETVHLAVLENNEMLHVRRVESHDVVRVSCPPGTRDRLHCTALGKAYLAGLSETDLLAVVENIELEKRTRNTITSRNAMVAEIEKTRARGYAIDNEEGRVGVRCVGLALLERGGRPVCAISLTGPAERWTQRAMDKVLGQLLAIVDAGANAAGLRSLRSSGARRVAS